MWISLRDAPTGRAPPRRCGGPHRRPASIVISVVSSKTASRRRTRGAAARPLSRSSRRADVLQHVVVGDGLALGGQLAPAALGAHLGAGGDEQLGRRVRGDHRADVAPVEHRAAGLGGEGALEVEQRRAHRRMDRHPAGRLAGRRRAQGRVGQARRASQRRAAAAAGGVRVVQIAARPAAAATPTAR